MAEEKAERPRRPRQGQCQSASCRRSPGLLWAARPWRGGRETTNRAPSQHWEARLRGKHPSLPLPQTCTGLTEGDP